MAGAAATADINRWRIIGTKGYVLGVSLWIDKALTPPLLREFFLLFPIIVGTRTLPQLSRHPR